MNYIENIFVCLVAPIMLACLCLRGHKRKRYMIAFLFGMTACLLSSYISTFIAVAMEMDTVTAAVEVTPVVEETMKFLPALFYLIVFEPEKESALNLIILISAGFATFENVCYLIENGAASITHLIIRGFGTGTMHIMCGVIVAWGIYYMWSRQYLRAAGTIGLISAAIMYHGIFNVLVSQEGATAIAGYIIPLISIAVVYIISVDLNKKASAEDAA